MEKRECANLCGKQSCIEHGSLFARFLHRNTLHSEPPDGSIWDIRRVNLVRWQILDDLVQTTLGPGLFICKQEIETLHVILHQITSVCILLP